MRSLSFSPPVTTFRAKSKLSEPSAFLSTYEPNAGMEACYYVQRWLLGLIDVLGL